MWTDTPKSRSGALTLLARLCTHTYVEKLGDLLGYYFRSGCSHTDANCLQTSQIQFAHNNGYATVAAKSAAPSRQDVQRTDIVTYSIMLLLRLLWSGEESSKSDTMGKIRWITDFNLLHSAACSRIALDCDDWTVSHRNSKCLSIDGWMLEIQVNPAQLHYRPGSSTGCIQTLKSKADVL